MTHDGTARKSNPWVLVCLFVVLWGSPALVDYIARERSKKDLALQIERMKSQVSHPSLAEEDVSILAEREISSSERAEYRQSQPVYVSHAQAWQVTYLPKPIGERSRDLDTIRIWVDDATRYVSRSHRNGG